MRFSSIAGKTGIFLDGDWIEKKDQDLDGKVRLIQLADIGAGDFKDKSDRYITESKAAELHCTFIQKGDILISRLGEPLCKACIFPYKGLYITAVDIAILRVGCNLVNSKYLVYLLNSPWFKEQVKHYESGTTRKRISRKNLDKIDIELPLLSEQERIVSRIEEMFSQLDDGVETLKKIKAQLAVYRQAVLKEAFENSDWPLKQTSEIGEVCLGRQRSPKNVSKDYPTKYIRAANITESGLALDDILEMEFTPQEREKYYLQKGDIVISEASGSVTQVGKPAVWNNEIENCCFQNTVIRLRLFHDHPKYVYWYLKYLYLSGAIAQIAGGVGINHLGANKFSSIEIPVPLLERQVSLVSEIESRLSVCDSIEQTVNTALQQAEALRQSILKDAFEGRL